MAALWSASAWVLAAVAVASAAGLGPDHLQLTPQFLELEFGFVDLGPVLGLPILGGVIALHQTENVVLGVQHG